MKSWQVGAGALLALLVVFEVYQPALRGPFVFDDVYLPFFSRRFGAAPLISAISGVRPLLMLSFWLNHKLSGIEPYSYHFFNVFIHLLNGVLVFFISRRLLEWVNTGGRQRDLLAAFAGGLFLLHPAQTESVAYVASRSEGLSVLFFYSAFALFLYRKSRPVSWKVTVGVLLLFGGAASTKEHTVVLPALLLLTDYFWNPGFSLRGIRNNWRLYLPLAAASAVGLKLVWDVVARASSAGFALKDLPWHDYLFTQCRALWVYFRLFVFPVGLNADYDYRISRTILEPGVLLGLAGLVILIGLAIYFRRRFPLACYGFLAALLLLAPTSSFIPIKDAVAERRLYLPMIGLLFVVLEFVRRWKTKPSKIAAALAAVLLVMSFLSYQRNRLWGNPVALWEDVVAKSPHNARAHFHLGVAYYQERRCDAALMQFETSARLRPPEHRLLVDWAMAEDCLGKPEAALEKLRRATMLEETEHAYASIGMIYAKQGRREEALAALEKAVKINARYDMTYVYRGHVYAMSGELAEAIADYRRALALNPNNRVARESLLKIEARLRGVR